ncbi:hypothetical protein [Streptomyces sp. NRRL B-24484]|uniref:hypothetical protein n=1 Tax=Streptomyces sp. NRRL B-24484 TaxID=1463833 RepID=UPI0004C146B1|nr:hypothetical protein [Streptomyces sp. NRRL B-24484]
MELTKDRRRAGGCAWVALWVLAAFVLATGGVLYGTSQVVDAWHWCLTQDHEPDPRLGAATRSVWAVLFVTLLVLGAVLSPLPRSRRYLLPVMVLTAAALTWLYVIGMGTPAPSQPGVPPELACWRLPSFPFTG